MVGVVNDLIKEHDLGVLCLMETNLSGERASIMIKRFSLDSSFVVRPNDKQVKYGACGITQDGI